jgi:hypothetical protein
MSNQLKETKAVDGFAYPLPPNQTATFSPGGKVYLEYRHSPETHTTIAVPGLDAKA